MDEYIKREDAIKAIIENPSKIGVFTAKAIRAIEDLPTADVVPKSEVERWRRQLEAVLEEIPETKREVAREIFEEIEKVAFTYYIDKETDKAYRAVELAFIAELKKKYTEREK